MEMDSFTPYGVEQRMVSALCYNLIIPSGFKERFFILINGRFITIFTEKFPADFAEER